MQEVFFYVFAALTLGFGFLVVANPFSRDPVTRAMCLVLTILSLAGLFVLLEAYFLAAVQVLVSAGAVMVLFLFVIMLLDVGAEQRRRAGRAMTVMAVASVLALGGVFARALAGTRLPAVSAGGAGMAGDVEAMGEMLLTRYLVPLEATGLVLLVAMVGVVLLGRKDLK
ncbi:MAG: NADH-quinone oxidoreductase subunit J [Verrucomicrobia bacterium]|nr:NADH-quinone oxidoreductase subunit J [Verrucomicrobiota bacterium]